MPVLCALALRPKKLATRDHCAGLLRFEPLLWALAHKKRVILTTGGALFIASLALFPFLGKEFMPTWRAGHHV